MNLADVQPFLAAAISASAELAAFGVPNQFSPFDDEAVFAAALGTALREKGVFIEIGAASLQRSGERTLRGIVAVAMIDILVAEAIQTEHTPRDKVLVKALLDAVKTYGDQKEPPAEFESYDSAIAEGGYILHAFTFSKNITV